MKRFFATAVMVLCDANPALAEKLGRASPYWLRHSRASHALEASADRSTVCDNLRHALIAATSTHGHGDDNKHAREMAAAFSTPRS